MPEDPFATPAMQKRIDVAVSRIQSKNFEWIAEPTTQPDDHIVQTLVEMLDAHAEIYLGLVDSERRCEEYRELLAQTGAALLRNVENRGPLSNPYSDQRLRKKAESCAAYRAAKTSEDRERALDNEVVRLAELLREDALKWDEWHGQLVTRILMRFEARYRHWAAEASEKVLSLAVKSEEAEIRVAHTTLPVTKWEEVEIWFISDERLRIDGTGFRKDSAFRSASHCLIGDFIARLVALPAATSALRGRFCLKRSGSASQPRGFHRTKTTLS
jgi:hypothetical protein